MQQSVGVSEAMSTRPKRLIRQPSYLKDYEVSAMHYQRPSSVAPPAPRESQSSQSHVTWNELYPPPDDNSLSFEESFLDTSRQSYPPMPYRTEGVPQSRLLSESMRYDSVSHHDTREGELTASARAPLAVQRDQSRERWPMPPLATSDDFQASEIEEPNEELPPPPWPTPEYPSIFAVGEEMRMINVLDRMMSELQLMKESVASNVLTPTHSHSTPRVVGPSQTRGGFDQYNAKVCTPRPATYSTVSHPPPVYHSDVGSARRSGVRPGMNQSYPTQSTHFSPGSVTLGGEYRGPTPKIPLFIRNDPMEFSRLKLALTNLLPADASELFKYQILVDHVKLEEACLIADSFINSPMPYTDTMIALTEKFGQPHQVALKRIAAVMDSSEVRRGDIAAFERFSLQVQSLVGMLQTLGPDGEVELRCGSHVARLLTKLPPEMRANFRRQMFQHSGHTHTLLDLAKWLRYESWCQGYDSTSGISGQGTSGYRVERKRSRPAATVLHGSESGQGRAIKTEGPSVQQRKSRVKPYCPFCECTEHFLNKCPAIQKLTKEEVIEWIRINKRCWRCGRAHMAAQCDLKRLCDVCNGKHLRVLHDANSRSSAEPPKSENCLVSTSTDVLYVDRPSATSRVLLKVVRVLLRNGGRTLDTYAILDDGSERTMLLPEAVDILNLQKKPEELALRTIRQEVQTLRGSAVSFTISPLANPKRNFRIREAFTSQRLGLADHSYPVASLKRRYKHLADLPLESFERVKPLILIGADYPNLLTPVEPVRLGPPGGPVAIRTRLGWTLQGPAHFTQWMSPTQQCLLTGVSGQTAELLQDVERLWQMDILPYQSSRLAMRSKQDREAVELLEAKTQRVQVGNILRYATPLLRRPNVPPLRAPIKAVLPNLRSLERRLGQDPLRAQEHSAAIHKLVEGGAVKEVDPKETSTTDESWYIPHHVVSHNGKNRLVFNCSFKFQGISLNDTLLPGPTLGPSLLGVLLRFREHAVAVSGDIRAMFHQVRLLPEDRSLLRFIWRDMRRDESPDVYEWQVLPFGTACSPCCATFALQMHARNHPGPGGVVTHSVEHCFYVDNCLQSVPNTDEAKVLVDSLRSVLSSGGFEIRQWACNKPEVLQHLPTEARSDNMEGWLSKNESGLSEPILGLNWQWETDTLGYKSRTLQYTSLTMRNVYKVVARQYDPLGFIAPYTTRAKLIVQSMWDKPRDWDDPLLPADLQRAWMEWESELPLLSSISLPRPYTPTHAQQEITSRQIHVFSDASEKAYGSVSYMRTEDTQGRVYLAFIAARSRVAPRKQHSVPRLELCGALTAAQLAKTIERELTVKLDQIVLWSDSTTVLTWLRSESCRFKVFVGTRVAEIQELTAGCTWRYVDSARNPADDVTRGKTLAELVMPNRWSQGPSFLLKGPAEWPSSPGEVSGLDTSEYRKPTSCGVVCSVDGKETTLGQSFSSWKALVEAVAEEAHGAADLKKPLSAEDYRQAELTVFRRSQSACFAEELSRLKAGRLVGRSSRLLTLSPELDPVEGVIRVGGRLRRAELLDPAFKHPIILDPSYWTTKLLIQDYDARLCHPGTERVFAEIRRQFWILRGREAIKRVQYQCQECRRWKSKPSIPKMSDLPVARLRLYKPAFYSTGVDCFGPFQVKLGRRSEKRWGIIYKCLTTRAVHLDLIHGMDADSFLMSLRRFIARRGTPAELYSDQGTNFRGGEKELSECFRSMSSDLRQLLAKQKIDFHFNPPAAPHFGGTWEREIKSVKAALYTVIGVQPISEEVLYTVLLEVEAILNSKPLGYTSSDVVDLDAITPNVLLMGRPDGALPQVVYPKSEGLSRRRWRHCQVIADHFWARFIRSYLPTLQHRQKWHGAPEDLTVGSVVLLIDPQFPRALWPIGRVVAVHCSADGHVRSADIQVKDKVYTRPVARLITLPTIPDTEVDEQCTPGATDST
ncbi:uncharacterized protein LOC127951863 [Carassius gibelio]|uniref:uncharacterized protein LOC127951863 n=1 Tax=Carassius gibelio TaxID=101364 RepID=UPI002278EE34|nr:uncharacterized protein LOC127951863 [Carassius gibelio]